MNSFLSGFILKSIVFKLFLINCFKCRISFINQHHSNLESIETVPIINTLIEIESENAILKDPNFLLTWLR